MNNTVTIPTTALEMMMGLTEAEIKTLLFVMCQIHIQEQDDVVLTYTDFVDGMFSGNGALITRPSGICHKSVVHALDSLENKGYIVRQRLDKQRKGIWGAPKITDSYGLGQRMRPARPWADNAVTLPEPTPFRPRRLKAELEARDAG